MFSSALRRTVNTSLFRAPIARSMATGPQSGGEISDELLAKLGSLSTQALVDGKIASFK